MSGHGSCLFVLALNLEGVPTRLLCRLFTFGGRTTGNLAHSKIYLTEDRIVVWTRTQTCDSGGFLDVKEKKGGNRNRKRRSEKKLFELPHTHTQRNSHRPRLPCSVILGKTKPATQCPGHPRRGPLRGFPTAESDDPQRHKYPRIPNRPLATMSSRTPTSPLGTSKPKSATYAGRCHCGAVQFSMKLSPPVEQGSVTSCNCSICRANGYLMVYPLDNNVVWERGGDGTCFFLSFPFFSLPFFFYSRTGASR